MKKLTYLLILISFCNSNAQNISSFFKKTDDFLKINIKNSKVNYDAIKSNPLLLEEILKIASSIDLSKENMDTKKAFWIDAYNLCVINSIIAKYPVNSPKDIPGFFNEITFRIANQDITLDNIENKMLREPIFDNRLHFALICGANGCPSILNKAYVPENLEAQLIEQTKMAINNPNYIKINVAGNKIILPQIFNWFEEDFGGKEIEFINKFRNEKFSSNMDFGFYNYDWSLNKVP